MVPGAAAVEAAIHGKEKRPEEAKAGQAQKDETDRGDGAAAHRATLHGDPQAGNGFNPPRPLPAGAILRIIAACPP